MTADIIDLATRGSERPRPANEASSGGYREGREKSSRIIKAAVTYCCSKATGEPGFIADHTADSLFAGSCGIVGGAHWERAERSLRTLVRLMNKADHVMTVELWSLASVAGVVLQEAEQPGAELVDEEMKYLKAFFRMVERLCDEQYDHERKAQRSDASH